MKPVIKICGMREKENILSVAELKPDLIGFIFYPRSPRYAVDFLDPEFLSSVSPDIIKTGVFVSSEFNYVTDSIKKFSLNAVQLHGNETPEFCRQIKNTGITVIKTFNINKGTDFSFCQDYVLCTDYFLFDTMTSGYGGSGHKFDWKLLEGYELKHPFFLSGGINPADTQEISGIKNPAFHGIDLNSGFEIRPGYKDIGKLKKFISELKTNYKIS